MSQLHTSYKLVTFNVYDSKPEDSNNNQNGSNKCKGGEEQFEVQMFGINEKGETAAIFVEGFTPFFYVKVADDWTDIDREAFILQLNRDMGEYYKGSVVSSKLVKRKTLYGFDAGKRHNFIIVKFRSEAALRKAKGLWYTYNVNKERILDPDGYECESVTSNNTCCTLLYEAQVPALLRLFHVKEISPSGWIALPNKRTLKHKKHSTSCTHEYTINYHHIIPLNEKEEPVPYKICAFDIEASSSHGDFPLAKKTYKKLAENIADILEERDENDSIQNYITNAVKTAFNIQGTTYIDGIQRVYPQHTVTHHELNGLIEEWLNTEPCKFIPPSVANEDSDDEASDNEEVDEGVVPDGQGEVTTKVKRRMPRSRYKTPGTVLDMLSDPKATRRQIINGIDLTMSREKGFPPLKGDEVTFIGSTFLRHGDNEPYLNHCVVRGSCDIPKQLDNCVIESYEKERSVLLAWSKLIAKENPDIVITYNGMGFDWQFMYTRAQELGCLPKFLALSRNTNEVCLSRKWNWEKKREEVGIETNTIFIASGQHDLKFVKMNGRLQIDLYNYFRREFLLTSYKLDYVAGHFIGDSVKSLSHLDGRTMIQSKNLTGLEVGSFITFEEEAHSIDVYKGGAKFEVIEINEEEGTFWINTHEEPDMCKRVRWGLAKDDVSPQDIFRMTNEGPAERAVIAKYCIQDCNLLHHLMRKIDVMTGYTEMSGLCSIPIDFLVMRGQGIKLTSYISKKCREKETLMPFLEKSLNDDSYEGAIVLPPKCDLYLDDPVACVDYSSLYPSSMISENISHDSKVWTKEFDLEHNLLLETGEKDELNNYIYDNLEDYEYVDITYDTYRWQHRNGNPKAAMEKVKVGYKICRFAQFPEGKGIMPSILEELLAERKRVRKLIPQQSDPFMANVLDKRQLSIKITANSMYGQTGAKTSTFYELDCAASTTAIGRKLLTYAQRVIEEAYNNILVTTECHGDVIVNAEYVYGDTDSVFFKFNPRKVDGEPIKGQKALEITIELAKQAGKLATMFLKKPHDLEYEKTFLPFCLLSKKRYVGMLYEDDPLKCKRKSMGIVLKRRDNAPIVKDIYGGVIDILMKDRDVEKAALFTEEMLQSIINESFPIEKLIITKSLRSNYKNPKQIAHNVLANRIGKRDPGNKPSVGDRIPFVYIQNANKKALQGDRIELPSYIIEHNIPINYSFYITNQIMKPLQQVFALVLEDIKAFRKKKGYTLHKWYEQLDTLKSKFPDPVQYKQKEEALRNKEVKALLFDKYIKT